MHIRTLPATFGLLLCLIVVGCGGSGATPDAAALPSDETGAEATTNADTGAGGGGVAIANACALLTADEVEAASGQPDVEPQASGIGTFDGQSQCTYMSAGLLPAVIVTVAGPDTNTDITGYLALPESVRLPVNGAEAAFVPAAGFMAFVIKHGLVVALAITAPAEGKEFQEVAAALVQPIADRMP